MEKMKKILNGELSSKWISILSLGLMVALLLPIVRIMLYCVPWYDDYALSTQVRNAWNTSHSLIDLIGAAINAAKEQWYAWQGTYASSFFMALAPMTWGDKYYIGLWIILALLILSCFCLIGVLMKKVLQADIWSCLFLQAVITGTIVEFMRSPIESLFWYNASVHYTAMHSVMLLMIAGSILLLYTKSRVAGTFLALGCILAGFIVGGSNYITALQGLLLMGSVLAAGLLSRNKRTFGLLPTVAVMAIGFYINVSAPGNRVRMAFHEGMGMKPAEAIVQSFVAAFSYLKQYMGWTVPVLMILIVPMVWGMVKKSSFHFRMPGLFLIWAFCLYATGFTPTLYVTGNTLIGRAMAVGKITFYILLFLVEIYLLGWLCRYTEKHGKNIKLNVKWWFYPIIGVILLGIFILEPNKGGKYTTYVSYYFVHTGEANNYHQEYLQRLEIFESDEKDVVVKPYVFKPWVLCLGDLSSDPNYEPNRFVANYYGKTSVICMDDKE